MPDRRRTSWPVLSALLIAVVAAPGWGAPAESTKAPGVDSGLGAATSVPQGAVQQGVTQQRVLVVPLENGVLEVDQLLALMTDPRSAASLPRTGWRIDLDDPAAQSRLALVRSMTGGMLTFERAGETLKVTIDGAPIRDRMNELENRIRGALREAFGTEVMEAGPPVYGLHFFTPDAPRAPLADLPAVPRRAVILVHGFDDPGWSWMNLLTALHARGYAVARFEYPNDGPIEQATDRLGNELTALRNAGVLEVDIVGHSMGGLVGRDLLTRDTWYGGDASGDDRLPAVRRFIMIGTPNHGSHMAHLAPLSETKDRLVRWLLGDDDLGGRADDGRGEAATQILPGSAFLKELNSRPLPRNVQTTIIAGRMVAPDSTLQPWIRQLREGLSQAAPEQAAEIREAAGRLEQSLSAVTSSLGDGLVSIESTRLAGVDDWVLVEGDHLGIIARYKSNLPEPPAIEIVIDRLGRPFDSSTPAPEHPATGALGTP